MGRKKQYTGTSLTMKRSLQLNVAQMDHSTKQHVVIHVYANIYAN